MIRTLTFVAALAFAGSALASPDLDANGKCRDGGKFVAAAMCKAPAAKPMQKCRDKTTKKFAACTAKNSEPMPK